MSTRLYRTTLRIWFTDMWGYERYTFNANQNYFTWLLGLRFNVEIDPVRPDVLIYSCFGNQHRGYSCRKLFFTGENTVPHGVYGRKIYPDYNDCDASMSFLPDSERNKYFPLWVMFVNWFGKARPLELPSNPTYLVEPESLFKKEAEVLEDSWDKKMGECAFINNNPVEDRVSLYKELSKYIRVDSYGTLFNNTGGPVRGSEEEKIRILEKQKSTIAYENSCRKGYNTEKIIHPYASSCLGIYSGGMDEDIFSGQGIINAADFRSVEELAIYTINILSSKESWIQEMSRPILKNNKLPTGLLPLNVLDWISSVLDL